MRSARYFLAALVAILLMAGGGYALWSVTRDRVPPSPELTTPMLALNHLTLPHNAPIFFTLDAVPYLKEHWLEWSETFGTTPRLPEEIAVQFDASLKSPQDWRALDRKWHFGTVLLTGDPANFRPLLDHLRQSPDWTLTKIDTTSLLFERSPARAWTIADVEPLLAVFETHSAREQNTARNQIALRLMYLGEMKESKVMLDQVIQRDPKSKEAWIERSFLHGMLGQWQESLDDATRAFALDSHYRPAQFAQAEAYYALGRFELALDVARALYESGPGDTKTLLLHAKVTHAAHAYVEEIEVLQRIISIQDAKSQPVGVWQIYMGQAYAGSGDGGAACEQFKAALKDPSLTQTERDFARKALERFEPRPDLLDSVPPLPKSSLLDAPATRP